MTIGIRTQVAKTKEPLIKLIDRRIRNSTKGLGYWGAYDADRRIKISANLVMSKH